MKRANRRSGKVVLGGVAAVVAIGVGCSSNNSGGGNGTGITVDTNAVKKVGSEFGKAARTAAPELKKIGGQIGQAAKTAAPKVRKAADSTVTMLGDEAMAARVKTAIIENRTLDSKQINVDVKEKKVILRGRVATAEQKRTAEAIAKREAPGYKLIDQLKITGKR